MHELRKQPSELLKVLLDNEDITETFKKAEEKNQNIKYRDFLTEKDVGKILQIKWRRPPNKRIECIMIRIRDIDSVFGGNLKN
jgi:hypothetical protein